MDWVLDIIGDGDLIGTDTEPLDWALDIIGDGDCTGLESMPQAGDDTIGDLGRACFGDCGIGVLKLKMPVDGADGDLGTAVDNIRVGVDSMSKQDTLDADGDGGRPTVGETLYPKCAVGMDIDIAVGDAVVCCAPFVPTPWDTPPYKLSMSSRLNLDVSGPKNLGIHGGSGLAETLVRCIASRTLR